MRLNATRLGSIASSRSFGDQLDDLAGQVPNLDLNFAQNKSLIDDYSGTTLVTFTRAGSATFVDSNGVLQSAVTNLLLRSEEFGTTWTPTGASVSSNVIAAPNGSLTADALIEDSSTGDHRINQASLSVSSGFCTYSIYVKANTRSRVAIQFDGTVNSVPSSALVNVDLSTGTTSGLTATGNITSPSSSISALLDGWYRVSVTASLSAATTGLSARLFLLQNTGGTSYTGNGTGSVYLWGAQLEQSSTVGDYVPTTSTINSAPRFDHNPTTGESLGLMVEEARTNSVTNNTMVGAVAGTPGTIPTGWLYATTSSNGLTQSIVGTGVENGINYIDFRYNGTTIASPNSCAIGIVNATAATAQTWTASTYWKLVGGTTTGVTGWQIGIIENTAGGSFLTGAFYAQTAPTSAALITQRPTATRTLSGGATVGLVTLPFNFAVAGSTAVDFTIRIGLPQLEQGAFATSVIPTTSATVTRAADVASITGSNFSSWYNHNEGTLRATASIRGGNTVISSGLAIVNGIAKLAESAVTANSRGIVFNTSTSPNRYSASQRSATTNVTVNDTTYETVQLGKYYNLTTSYVNNSTQGLALSVDGRTVITNATAVDVPVPTRLLIGAGNSGSNTGVGIDEYYLNGTIKRLTFWPTRLANTTLQAISQP